MPMPWGFDWSCPWWTAESPYPVPRAERAARHRKPELELRILSVSARSSQPPLPGASPDLPATRSGRDLFQADLDVGDRQTFCAAFARRRWRAPSSRRFPPRLVDTVL